MKYNSSIVDITNHFKHTLVPLKMRLFAGYFARRANCRYGSQREKRRAAAVEQRKEEAVRLISQKVSKCKVASFF